MPDRENENFLSRWSRRKRQPGDEETEDRASSEPADAGPALDMADPEAFEGDELPQRIMEIPEEELSDAEREWLENRRRAEAVDLETIGYESDFALFLKRGVPRVLRKKALRKLWASNPLLANIDGLNDYDEDFGDPALNTFTSIWQVGRGYLTDADKAGGSVGVSDSGSPSAADAVAEDTGETQADGAPALEDAESDAAAAEPDTAELVAADNKKPVLADEDDEEPAARRVSLRDRWNFDNS